MNSVDISNIESIVGYTFNDKKYLITAFTHSSYANEHDTTDYERLEFLGDSLLESIMSIYLYKHFETYAEGDLSKIRARVVSAHSLYNVVSQLNLIGYIRVGGSVDHKNIPLNIVADVFEGIVGAIYVDGGIDNAKTFVETKLIKSELNINKIFYELMDYKTTLQERLQAVGKHAVYESNEIKDGVTINFETKIIIDDKVCATHIAQSKKAGEQACAKAVLENKGGIL